MMSNAALEMAFDTAALLAQEREELAVVRERKRGNKVLAWVSLAAVVGWFVAGYLLVTVAVLHS